MVPRIGSSSLVTGYNSLPGAPPLDRTEFYELWWRQSLFSDAVVVRFGKLVPTNDFDNVVRPVPVQDPSLNIPAVSGLLYTPIFVNPTILGFQPGYYNSAYGVTATLAPSKSWYLSLGTYDGNGARGVQTGLETAPTFNGYRFQIGEIGGAWLLGAQGLPGSFAVGAWDQTGQLTLKEHPTGFITQDGAPGRLHVRIATSVEGPRRRRRLRLHSVRRKRLADDPVRKPLFRVGAYRIWPHPGQARRFARRGTRLVGTEPESLVPRR